MASASWYSTMVSAYTGSPSPFPANGAYKDIMEFAITLGSTMAGASSSSIALLTMPSTGILATCSLVLELTAALQDINPADATQVYSAGVHNFQVTIPMSSLTTITNTCPSPSDLNGCNASGQVLMLYTYVTLSDHVDVNTPSQIGRAHV